VILEAIRSVEGVLADPPPEALVSGLAASAVNIRAAWWISPPRRSDLDNTRSAVLIAIRNAFSEKGIDLPYQTQQILFHDQTEEIDGDRSRQREGWPARNNQAPKPGGIARAIREGREEREAGKENGKGEE
jgi:small-conductance mechanosensitive channel